MHGKPLKGRAEGLSKTRNSGVSLVLALILLSGVVALIDYDNKIDNPWPSGTAERLTPLQLDAIYTVIEGKGIEAAKDAPK